MPAYLIVDLTVHDAARYEAYKREVPRFMQRHGGEYVVRGGELEVIEGSWRPQRLVVMRFPSRQAIREFQSDPEYQALAGLRRETATTNAIAVDGV